MKLLCREREKEKEREREREYDIIPSYTCVKSPSLTLPLVKMLLIN